MENIEISCVESEDQLCAVLEMCYRILGERLREVEQYTYEAWRRRMEQDRRLMLFAREGSTVASAVLARRESDESLVCGFVACEEKYRGRGITKRLMLTLENEARNMGFKYITLGSDADGFYESCGFKAISVLHGQTVYQKTL